MYTCYALYTVVYFSIDVVYGTIRQKRVTRIVTFQPYAVNHTNFSVHH